MAVAFVWLFWFVLSTSIRGEFVGTGFESVLSLSVVGALPARTGDFVYSLFGMVR